MAELIVAWASGWSSRRAGARICPAATSRRWSASRKRRSDWASNRSGSTTTFRRAPAIPTHSSSAGRRSRRSRGRPRACGSGR